MGPLFRRLERALRLHPLESTLAIAAVAVGLYVVAYPFSLTRYPPITDLPFHAAMTSALRHFSDPAWHFADQFELQPIAVPYLSLYALGALFMLALPPVAATKAACVVLLALLPAGLAVLFDGMKKSPLLGLLGLGFVWCNLTHWGFINFVAALGLFAMVVGLTLKLLDRPTRGRALALGAALFALFVTHIFRYPFALAAVLGTALVMWPATRRLRPVALPLLGGCALFAVWWRARTDALGAGFDPFDVHPERLRELAGYLFGAFHDPAELRAAKAALRVAAGVAAVSAAAFVVERRFAAWHPRDRAFAIGAAVVALGCAGAFLLMFLTLPMQMGVWWYVYPREAVAASFLALSAMPDLPRARWLRAVLVVALAAAAARMGSVVAKNWAPFDRATADFHAITRRLPHAPKLLYLVFDHGGSTRTTTPFIHLPAWVQAERGGWLSFHFAVWNATPFRYRDRSDRNAVVPPPVPLRWEWTPHLFDVRKHGRFFDWFLVRRRSSPDALFAADPTIRPVDRAGTWWLYRRIEPTGTQGPGPAPAGGAR